MKTRSWILGLLGVVVLGCGGEPLAGDPGPPGGWTPPGSGAGGANGAPDLALPPDCNVSPASFVEYETEAELAALLVGRWQRCRAPQVAGEDVGVEFTAEHRWYPLTRRGDGGVVPRTGVDYGGTWRYLPPGEKNLISGRPDPRGQFVITAITDPPQFTDNPRQLRVLLSPVLSVYVPLK